jgi:peptidoglycan/xylan/chitin deacetylase (PgdA/CDA1 family)
MTPEQINEKISEKIEITSEVRLGIFLIIIFGVLVFWSRLAVKPEVPVLSTPASIHATSDKEIIRGDTSKKQVIFTFDGGDGVQSAQKILEVLAKHHVRGTFFLTGKFVELHQELSRQIASEGHEIFNHTYDHPHLTAITNKEISLEMRKMENVLQQVVGTTSKPFFRPPYGDRDAKVLASVFHEGYQSVYWTVDALDWEESTGKTASEVKNIILSNLAPGNIYLMHIGDTITGTILDEVFTTIEEKGYKIVSLKQGL